VLSNPSLDNNKLLNENANYTCENFERVAEINNSIQQANTSLQSWISKVKQGNPTKSRTNTLILKCI